MEKGTPAQGKAPGTYKRLCQKLRAHPVFEVFSPRGYLLGTRHTRIPRQLSGVVVLYTVYHYEFTQVYAAHSTLLRDQAKQIVSSIRY